jgi:hypothetical protein
VGQKRFQFEQFWLKLDGFKEVVDTAWAEIDGDPDPFRQLVSKLKSIARQLMSCSDKKVGCIKLQLMTAREVVYRLDVAMEPQQLSADERAICSRIKHTYLGLASLERIMARKRAKVTWLCQGDANTTFFHQYASYRRQKNGVRSIQVDGAVIMDHAAMAEATFHHLEGLLGTSVGQDFSLDLDYLAVGTEDHSDLHKEFSEEEISDVVRRLPHGKAPGLDGFTAESLQSCWGTVKGEVMVAIDKLFLRCGRGFQGLNKALLVLLSKRPDAAALGDYCPIILTTSFLSSWRRHWLQGWHLG